MPQLKPSLVDYTLEFDLKKTRIIEGKQIDTYLVRYKDASTWVSSYVSKDRNTGDWIYENPESKEPVAPLLFFQDEILNWWFQRQYGHFV